MFEVGDIVYCIFDNCQTSFDIYVDPFTRQEIAPCLEQYAPYVVSGTIDDTITLEGYGIFPFDINLFISKIDFRRNKILKLKECLNKVKSFIV